MSTTFTKTIKAVGRVRCFLLTCVIVISMLLSAVLSSDGIPFAILTLLYDITILMAPYFISGNKRLFHVTLIVGAILLLPNVMILFTRPTGLIDYDERTYTLFEVIALCFEILLVVCVMRYSIVTKGAHEPIFGCILTYLLLGIVFGNIYFLIQIHMPGAFCSSDNSPLTRNDLHYMSFITLSTCGFGDIVPKLPLAKTLAYLEAICGVMYVALFIGRMISHIPLRFPPES